MKIIFKSIQKTQAMKEKLLVKKTRFSLAKKKYNYSLIF